VNRVGLLINSLSEGSYSVSVVRGRWVLSRHPFRGRGFFTYPLPIYLFTHLLVYPFPTSHLSSCFYESGILTYLFPTSNLTIFIPCQWSVVGGPFRILIYGREIFTYSFPTYPFTYLLVFPFPIYPFTHLLCFYLPISHFSLIMKTYNFHIAGVGESP